ncbi:MAG: DUF4386 family protein, partial [Actinomycetota bacterium]|nr:DUF4386 family protein [Actinomycetota bacterium]
PWLAERATDAGASAEARADATDTFEFLNTLLGTVVGETLGYLLTALWTVLVVRAFRRRIAGRWFAALGLAAAALILLGIAVPLDLPGADLANFVGYILWTLWLIAFAVTLWRRRLADTADSKGPAAPPERPAAPGDSTPRAMSTNREALLMGWRLWRGRRLQRTRVFRGVLRATSSTIKRDGVMKPTTQDVGATRVCIVGASVKLGKYCRP